MCHSLTCNISGVFCATTTVLSIMESAMPEQNCKDVIIYIALFNLKLWQFRHVKFFEILKFG